MIYRVWQQIPDFYTGVDIDAFIVMPNHIHGIIVINHDGQSQRIAPTAGHRNVRADPRVCPEKLSLSAIVQRYKAMTTKQYTDGVKQNGWQPFYKKLWQRNYYDHVTRNENDLNTIRQYIFNNPGEWSLDTENPDYQPAV